MCGAGHPCQQVAHASWSLDGTRIASWYGDDATQEIRAALDVARSRTERSPVSPRTGG